MDDFDDDFYTVKKEEVREPPSTKRQMASNNDDDDFDEPEPLADEVDEKDEQQQQDVEDPFGVLPTDDAMLMPPPTTTSRTTVDAAVPPLAAPTQIARKRTAQNAAAQRLRVNDVTVLSAASVNVPPVTTSTSAATPKMEPQTLDHYTVAKRLAAQQTAAEFGGGGGDGAVVNNGSASSKIGDSAAQVNHFLIHISDVRARVDPTIVSELPYATKTTGAQIGRSFYMHALTAAPHTSRPVSENSEALRKLASKARGVRRAHIEAMRRTPKLREETCANGDGCVVFRFCDAYNKPLARRQPMVAFLYEDEMATLRVDRKAIVPTWHKRACVECMICAGNRVLTNLRFRNQALDAHNYLAVPFYVEVDVPGEYPLGATLGPGKGVFEGLVFNMPRFSELDWVMTTRHEGGEEIVQYVQSGVPPFPVPRETLAAHARQGFSVAL